MQLVLISGLAGAGKSTALKILEDNGYYCIDNLPPPMLRQLLETHLLSADIEKIAVSIDTRSRSMLKKFPLLIKEITQLKIDFKAIYLDATNQELVRRFSETRRKHPLSGNNKTIIDCIRQEREMLSLIGEISHRIDTTALNANGLRTLVKQFVETESSPLNIVIQSFGFKYGLPIDSDFVFDVRCLPNPFYNLQIRELTGLEQPVIDFLEQCANVKIMIDDIASFISKWLNAFALDNRNYITISVGCTGGKHRSVYVVEQIATIIRKHGYKITIRHRQIS